MNMPMHSWSQAKWPESNRERSGFHLRPPNIRNVARSPCKVTPYSLFMKVDVRICEFKQIKLESYLVAYT